MGTIVSEGHTVIIIFRERVRCLKSSHCTEEGENGLRKQAQAVSTSDEEAWSPFFLQEQKVFRREFVSGVRYL